VRDVPALFLFMAETTTKPDAAPVIPAINPPDAAALPVVPGNLTESLIAGMPAVPENRPAPIFNTDEPKLPDPGTLALPGILPPEKDEAGNLFNPLEHAAEENGTPKRNSKGLFYSKFIGRGGAAKRAAAGVGDGTPAGHSPFGKGNVGVVARPLPKFEGAPETANGGPGDTTTAQPAATNHAEPDAAEGMSLMIIPTVDGIAQALFGKEIALTPEDISVARPAVAGYMRAKNAKDISPGWALVLICTAIYGPKFAKPTVKERVTLLFLKIKNFIGGSKK
jgi:hypothetical protein